MSIKGLLPTHRPPLTIVSFYRMINHKETRDLIHMTQGKNMPQNLLRRKSWTQINQCTLSKNLHQPIEFWLAVWSHCHFYMYLCLIYLFTSYSHIKYMGKQLIYIQKCKLYNWNQWILLYSNKIVNLCWWNIIISNTSPQ